MIIRNIGKTEACQIWCSACGMTHNINSDPKLNGAWTFDGDFKKPTIKPGLKITSVDSKGNISVCEFSITEGVIYYTKKCTHKLAGTSADLLDLTNK